jgi:hypothetical protein
VRTIAILVAGLCLALAGAGEGGTSGPPNGLTEHGRTLWNLEALLHDTFGTNEVWVHYLRGTGPRAVWNFSTAATALCCGGNWEYTFASARDSEFAARKLARRLYPQLGASGGEIPLTIRGRYISCGGRRWLHIHIGNGPANSVVSCLRPYRP